MSRKTGPEIARTEARKRAPAPAPVNARTRTHTYERVRKAVAKRRRLGGFTCRYHNQEMKVSKNDVVRLAK